MLNHSWSCAVRGLVKQTNYMSPLSDRGNNVIICTSSSPCLRITTLYNYKLIQGHSILVYLSMSGMRNSIGNAATGKSSYPSQIITPFETCNNLILCSILSIRAWVSSVTHAGATTECGIVSVCPCRINAPACGADWTDGGGGGGTVWSYCMVWPDGGGGGIVESCGVLPWIGISWT